MTVCDNVARICQKQKVARQKSVEREKSSKFINGDARAEPLGQIPSRTSPSLRTSLNIHHMRVELAWWNWLEPQLATPRQRKSLRLTGSHGITGTQDIYTSVSLSLLFTPVHLLTHPFRPCTHPTDRSITRNKEIANLLPVRYCPTGAGELASDNQELFQLLWVASPDRPATFQVIIKKRG